MRKNNNEFRHKREVILFLYDYSCQLCGLVSVSNHVHHIDKNGSNHNAFNLIPLCDHCHRLTHKLLNISFAAPDPYLQSSLQKLNSNF